MATAIGGVGAGTGIDGDEGLPSCSEAGWLSYLTYAWVNPLVSVGAQRQIALGDTPKLAEADDTFRNTHGLLENLAAAERVGSAHPLLRAVVLTFWFELLCMEAFNVAMHFLVLLNPLLLQQVLVFQEGQPNGLAPAAVTRGMAAMFGLIGLNLFKIVFSSQTDLFKHRLQLRIASALKGTVLIRCVQGAGGNGGPATQAASEEGAGGPTVYNVLSFDVGPNVDIIWIVLGLWIFPLQFSTTLGVLIHQVHSAAIPGLVTIIIAKVVVGVMLFCDGLYRHQLLMAKDLRLNRCNEGFNSIRTLQMLSWAGIFQDRIMEARHEELSLRARRLWMNKMCAALDYSLGPIVTLVTLAYFIAISEGELKASVALPVISLIQGLIGPFGNFPVWINEYLVWRSAYERVNQFLGLRVPRAGGGARPDTAAAALRDGDEVAALENCTLSWGSASGGGSAEAAANRADKEAEALEAASPLLTNEGFALREVDVRVRGGELLVLVGTEGQGKSSLLLGLLGEMTLEAGVVHSPAVARRIAEAAAGVSALVAPTAQGARQQLADGSTSVAAKGTVPYAAQEVLLMTGTVQQNILFGSRHEPELYHRVLAACALEADLASMPAGDLTEVAQGGANLSGGQKARVGLARASYAAALLAQDQAGPPPLVLLDDPFCALDRRVAREVCEGLFSASGLLAPCAVVLATADPWWLRDLAGGPDLQVAVLREGTVVASGAVEQLRHLDLPELQAAVPAASGDNGQGAGGDGPPLTSVTLANPQDALELPEDTQAPAPPQEPPPRASPEEAVQVVSATKAAEPSPEGWSTDDGKSGQIVEDEHREDGHVKCETYLKYLHAVGAWRLCLIAISLTGISLFQNFCNLWIVYWTSEHRSQTKFYKWMAHFTSSPPTSPDQLILVYAIFTVCFTASNFAGHAFEILGGIGAARVIFDEALRGTFVRPFRWWDSNPTGRVLNRFSEDVEVMDAAITNILGVLFGAVLYLVSHSAVLAIANPFSLVLLPLVVLLLEIFARYYRRTIREVQRLWLVCMGAVYQEMVEAIVGRVTVRSFGATQRVLCSALISLDNYQRIGWARTSVQLWVGFRMSLIGYLLGLYNTLYPLFQYVGLLHAQSAALVGFSINYSQEMIAIVQQLILNYSDLEMQLVSIERLQEYSATSGRALAAASLPPSARGLCLANLEVRYRETAPPVLRGVSLLFPPGEAAAIVGRTGAGKSSLLLSVLQLVPYSGRIEIGGHALGLLNPEDVRRRLVGVVPQHPVIFAGDLRWNLDPEEAHSDAQIFEALRLLGLQSLCCGPEGLQADTGSSGLAPSLGQRQLLCAVRVLLRRPRVAMLDEVTASLPPEVASSTVGALIGRFKEHGAAVLLVTHQEDLLPSCERVITLASGCVVGDTRGNDATGTQHVSL